MTTSSPKAGRSTQSRRDPNARSVTFRLPLMIYEAIQGYADDERRTLNAVTCLLLEEAISARILRETKERNELEELRKLARQQRKAERDARAANS